MQISISNSILSSSLSGVFGVLTKGLKMWLSFAKSIFIGKESVTNGDFATDSDWTTSGGATTSGGVGYIPNGGQLSQSIGMIAGKTYSYTIIAKGDSVTGDLRVASGGTEVFEIEDLPSTFQTYTGTFVGIGATLLLSEGNAGDITIQSISVKEVSQFAADKSGNSNVGLLQTGKALSFNGSTDDAEILFDTSIEIKTIAFWIRPLSSGSQQPVLYRGGGMASTRQLQLADLVLKSINSNIQMDIYVDGVLEGQSYGGDDATLSLDAWQRVVLVATDGAFTGYYSNIFIATGPYKSTNGHFDLSDLQIYNETWDAADIAYDYDNPQNLVTDNPDTSIELSDLDIYLHLSEGDTNLAYNSALVGGEDEKVENGDFSDGTNDWTPNANASLSIVSGALRITNSGTNGRAVSDNFDTEAGKTYSISLDAIARTGTTYRLEIRDSDGFGSEQAFSFTESTAHSFIFTAAESVTTVVIYAMGDSGVTADYDNISVKEVSVLEIDGGAWETALSTIPQLGMMDWAKSTVGTDEITLIQAPNNVGYDVLGNALKLRENAFNLDGSGYAKVADDDSLDITTTITLEAWVKLDPFVEGNLDHIIGKRTGGTWCRIYRPEANVLRMEVTAGGNLDIAVDDGDWCHIVGTIDGTDGKLYYNSGAPEETVYGSTFTWDLDIPVGVGAWFNTSSTVSATSKTIGIIDEPRVYNRALSAGEINQNYNAGKSKHKN